MAWSRTSLIAVGPGAPAAARGFVEQALSGLYRDPGVVAEARQDVEVIVSELVTNAVQAASASLAVELTVDAASVRLAVTDEAGGLPVASPITVDQPSGRGLAIVAALSSDWGVTPRADSAVGKTVWARLTLDPPPDRL